MPVNNLLVRSRPACSASHRVLVSGALELLIPAPGLPGLAAFAWHFRDREDLTTSFDIKPFAITKRLARRRAWESHPPPRAHSPRIPGAFTAGHVIVWSYPPVLRGCVAPPVLRG